MPDLFMTNSEYHIRECENGDCYLKHLRSGRFFFKPSLFASEKYQFDKIERFDFGLKDGLFLVIIFATFISVFYLIYNYEKYARGALNHPHMGMFTVAFLLVNVFLHECAHGWSLRFYGHRVGKLRLRFYYFLPVISVETSDVYLLPKFRAACVCAAGLMMNIFLCSAVIFFFPQFSYVVPPVISLICFNIIPFSGVKTDGYNIIVTIAMGVIDFRGKKNKINQSLKIVLNIVLIIVVGNYIYGFFN